MSWENRDTMSIREEFIKRLSSQKETFSELCQEYKISRKTGYKWRDRFKEEGYLGLKDRPKRPNVSPNQTPDDMVYLMLEIQKKHPVWGGRKLRQVLINQGYQNLPCEKTFQRMLSKHKESCSQKEEKAIIRFERTMPNELWQMDFKGHFQVEEGRCHPLTVLDDHSRFSICIKGCLSESEVNVRQALEESFRQYGLPDAMTMDNGSPWKGSAPFRLSRLTVWLMRLGIKVSHSTPYHPQTQGKDERFHRTLKDEVLKFYQFKTLEDIQQRFDEWREVYNFIRPHDGINLLCPSQRYKKSLKPFPEKLEPLEYPTEYIVRKVGPCGTISLKDKPIYVGEHLYQQYVGLMEVSEGTYDAFFSTTKIKRFKMK